MKLYALTTNELRVVSIDNRECNVQKLSIAAAQSLHLVGELDQS